MNQSCASCEHETRQRADGADVRFKFSRDSGSVFIQVQDAALSVFHVTFTVFILKEALTLLHL